MQLKSVINIQDTHKNTFAFNEILTHTCADTIFKHRFNFCRLTITHNGTHKHRKHMYKQKQTQKDTYIHNYKPEHSQQHKQNRNIHNTNIKKHT